MSVVNCSKLVIHRISLYRLLKHHRGLSFQSRFNIPWMLRLTAVDCRVMWCRLWSNWGPLVDLQVISFWDVGGQHLMATVQLGLLVVEHLDLLRLGVNNAFVHRPHVFRVLELPRQTRVLALQAVVVGLHVILDFLHVLLQAPLLLLKDVQFSLLNFPLLRIELFFCDVLLLE